MPLKFFLNLILIAANAISHYFCLPRLMSTCRLSCEGTVLQQLPETSGNPGETLGNPHTGQGNPEETPI